MLKVICILMTPVFVYLGLSFLALDFWLVFGEQPPAFLGRLILLISVVFVVLSLRLERRG